jgi:hypothetical protein
MLQFDLQRRGLKVDIQNFQKTVKSAKNIKKITGCKPL